MIERVQPGDLIRASAWSDLATRLSAVAHDPHRRLGELRLMDRGEAFWFGPFECSDYYLWMTFASPIYVAGTDGCTTPKWHDAVRVWAITRTDATGAWMDRRHMWAVQEPTSREWYTVPCCDLPDSSSPDSSSPDSSSPDSSSPDSSSPGAGPPAEVCCPITDNPLTTCPPPLDACEVGLYGAASGCFLLPDMYYHYVVRLYSCITGPGPLCCWHDSAPCHDAIPSSICGDQHTITHVQWTRLRCTPPYVGHAVGLARSGEWSRAIGGRRSANNFMAYVAIHCSNGQVICDSLIMIHTIDRMRLTWQCGESQTVIMLDVELSDMILSTSRRLFGCRLDCPTTATYSGTFPGPWRPEFANWWDGRFYTGVILPLVGLSSTCGVYDVADHCDGGPWQFPSLAHIFVRAGAL